MHCRVYSYVTVEDNNNVRHIKLRKNTPYLLPPQLRNKTPSRETLTSAAAHDLACLFLQTKKRTYGGQNSGKVF